MKKLIYVFPLVGLLIISCEKELEKLQESPEVEPSGQVVTLNNGQEGDADGILSTALFNEPAGIEAGRDGSVYVVDHDNFKIKKINPDGEVITLAGSVKGHADGQGANALFHSPASIAEAADGTLYVTDSCWIRKISPSGEVSTLTGRAGPGYLDGPVSSAKFNTPAGIAIGEDGSLFVADMYNNKIRKISPDGMVSTVAGSEEGFENGTGTKAKFNHPPGIAISKDGTLYVADSWNHRIRKITPEGEVSTLAGDGEVPVGTGYGAMFIYPMDLEVGIDGNIYVADTYHYRVRKITPEGVVTTISGDIRGYADGSLKEAQFMDIFGIAVNQDGSIFLTESNNDRIRKIVIE